VESVVAKWGDELFFSIKDVPPGVESRTKQVNVGDVAFCPDGNCLCVFLGETPASVLENPVPENPVVVIGRVITPPDRLKAISAGEKIKVLVAEKSVPSPEKDMLPISEYATGRKLSQAEIDALVKQLLAEKNKTA
jgi:hypothetical protein